MKRRTFLGLGLGLAPAALVNPGLALGWGAFSGVKNTHKLIVENAMHLLKQDQIFMRRPFPPVHNIVKHDYVSYNPVGGIYGTGPDAEGNSPYSYHYYNPYTGQGQGPRAVQIHFERLIQACIKDPNGDGAAGSASWAGHFLADMHVPYHVVGLARGEAINRARRKSGYLSPDEGGPLFLYNGSGAAPEYWGQANNFVKALYFYLRYSQHDANQDWYDPWYYNGYALRINAFGAYRDIALTEKSSVLFGSHANWELRADWDAAQAGPVYQELIKSGFYDPKWENRKVGASEDVWRVLGGQARLFAAKCAQETRDRLKINYRNSMLATCRAIRAVASLYRASVSAIKLDYRTGRQLSDGVEVAATAYNNSPNEPLHDVDFTLNYQDRGQWRKLFLTTNGAVYPGQSVTRKFKVPVRPDSRVQCTLDATGLYRKTPDACYVYRVFQLARKGSDKEICGDGIDNNGNKLIDEGCNFRREIIIDDNQCKDDTIGLMVDGRNYGTNPAGHKRHFNISNLSPGRHEVTVVAVNSGGKAYGCNDSQEVTYSIKLGQGIKFVSGGTYKSGSINAGKAKRYQVIVN